MNKAFALAVLISTASFGTVYAAEMAPDVNVVFTNPDIDNSAKQLDIPDIYVHPSADMIQSAQAEIKSDSALRHELQAQSVELNNVTAIQTAADGSQTVYVR